MYTTKSKRVNSEWMTTAEVAKILQVSGEAVRGYVKDGKLKCSKIGPKTWRYKETDVEEFINSMEAKYEGK